MGGIEFTFRPKFYSNWAKKNEFNQLKEYKMAEIVNNTELLVSNMFEIQALIRLLERKGIITQVEILGEVKKLQREAGAKINKSGKKT